MSNNASARKRCKIDFNVFLVRDAKYDGMLGIPCVKAGLYKPKKVISFSKCTSAKVFDSWVHFYEDDVVIEKIWNDPQKYLPILSKFEGIISPDFSLYRDMPLAMQYWNIYRNHALAAWFQKNGVKVIPNIRYGDERTHAAACLGIEKHGTIAIGSHGCIKVLKDREVFIAGLDSIVKLTEPRSIVVYGTTPDYIFDKYKIKGIEIHQFDSEFALSRKRVN